MSTIIYDAGGAASTIAGILKDDYVRKGIVDNVNKSTELLKRLKSQQSSHGLKHMFSTQFGTSQSAGAIAENAALPAPGQGEYDKPWGNVKYLYNRFRVTGPAISATKGNKAAFGDTITQSVNDCRDGLRLDIQRQVWGDGSGVVGVVETTSATAVVAVTRPYGYTYAGTLTGLEKTLLFRRKQVLFFATAGVSRTVVGVDQAAGTITLDSAVSVTAGELIYKGIASTAGLEIEGLGAIVAATGTYMNIARAGIPEWQGNIVDATDVAGLLSEDLMRIAKNAARRNGTGDPNLTITDFDGKRFYENTQKSFKRHVNPMKLEGGATAVEFDGMPLIDDKDAPPQHQWQLDTTSITWFVMEEVDWADLDGNMLKQVSGYDAWEAFLRTYKNLGCYKPANQTVIKNIVGWETAPATGS